MKPHCIITSERLQIKSKAPRRLGPHEMASQLHKHYVRTLLVILLISLSACAEASYRGDTISRIYKAPTNEHSGYEVVVRQAETPKGVFRELDKSLLFITSKSKRKESPKQAVTEKKPVNLRRTRIQLRRNRYLLLQDG